MSGIQQHSYSQYAYGYNNPLKYTDPTGHFTEDELNEYFGYSGDGYDGNIALQMEANGLDPSLIAWLMDQDTTWGDVATIFNAAGERIGEVMLVLLETAPYSDTYRGGLWAASGIEALGAGLEALDEYHPGISGHEVDLKSVIDARPNTLEAIDVQNYYSDLGYFTLPTHGGESAFEYRQRDRAADAGTFFTLSGLAIASTTCIVAPGCLTVLGIAGVGASVGGGVAAWYTWPGYTPVPVILQPNPHGNDRGISTWDYGALPGGG